MSGTQATPLPRPEPVFDSLVGMLEAEGWSVDDVIRVETDDYLGLGLA